MVHSRRVLISTISNTQICGYGYNEIENWEEGKILPLTDDGNFERTCKYKPRE